MKTYPPLRDNPVFSLSDMVGFAHGYLSNAKVVHDCTRRRLALQNATGHGNRAAKRAAQIETARWFDEIDAEQQSDYQADFPRAYAAEHGLNFHDL